jgi:acylphosphatase
MSDERTVRLRIAGGVQGVGYRYWTERTAHELGLSGWVRNRRDGTVEAVISGSTDAVDRMIERCREGPRAAQVTSIDVGEEPAKPSSGFEVLPTA